MQKVIILQPEIKKIGCGITDHSKLLACGLNANGVSVDILDANQCRYSNFKIKGAAIFLQMSLYGYNKKGIPLWLINYIKQLKKDNKIVIYFHELWVEHAELNQSAFWVKGIQRYICQSLMKESELSWFNNEWSYECGRIFTQASYLPSFSNVGEPKFNVAWEDRDNSIAVFGSIKNRSEIYKEIKKEIESMLIKGVISRVHDIGVLDDKLNSLINEIDGQVVRHGPVDAGKVSKILSSNKYGIINSPIELASKSGVFSAMQAHGVLCLNIEKYIRGYSRPIYYPVSGRHLLSFSSFFEDINNNEYKKFEKIAENGFSSYIKSDELVKQIIKIL